MGSIAVLTSGTCVSNALKMKPTFEWAFFVLLELDQSYCGATSLAQNFLNVSFNELVVNNLSGRLVPQHQAHNACNGQQGKHTASPDCRHPQKPNFQGGGRRLRRWRRNGRPP
jgi:hypothetical protein